MYIKQSLPSAGDTCIVGMSGGVDSTLTAILLKEKGCRVIGVTMSLWDGKIPDGITPEQLGASCYGPSEPKNILECEKFCKENDIEYHVVNVQEEYQKNVIEYFKAEYRAGRTPNPCIRCNEAIKFGALLDGVKKLGIEYDYFCTGHYATIVKPETGIWGTDKTPAMISSPMDSTKDQTYFLYRVSSEILEKVRFPLCDVKKSDVFQMAMERNLIAAQRKESQDFVPSETFDMFFSDKESIPGDIIDLDGKVLGRHRGIEHYTIGQRRGLGVAVNYPVYVQAIDPVNNIVVLAKNEDLNSDYLLASDMVWAGGVEPAESFEAMVKIRLASKPVLSKIEKISSEIENPPSSNPESWTVKNGKKSDFPISDSNKSVWKVTFSEPQRAVAPGQSAVFYKDGVILGGGIILPYS